jgi:subtilisin family serine protease
MQTRIGLSTVLMASVILAAATPAHSDSELRSGRFAVSHRPGELIIKFKQRTGLAERSRLLDAVGARVLHRFESNGAVFVRIPKALTTARLKAVADWLLSHQLVDYVEPNATIRAFSVLPNDPEFGKLYGLHNTGEIPSSTSDADIDAPEAWEKGVGSHNIRVAVIDSGIDYTHPDLSANIWLNPGESGLDALGNNKSSNGVDDDGNGYIDDLHGWNFVANNNNPYDDNVHGTHCAGTIGAVGNNGVGVVGVNWNVSLVPIKFLDKNGGGTTVDAIKAVEYATKLNVDIMSNSWGGGPFSETLEAAIKEANTKGILFVAAAGNDTRNNDKIPTYPASYQIENIVSVAATGKQDRLADFSSYGRQTVHLAAPGVGILSTIPQGRYAELSGTSMATPLVAGAAALIKAKHPELSAIGLKRRLLASVDRTDQLGDVTSSGGRLNVANALDDDTTAPSSPSDLAITSTRLTGFSLVWRASGDDGNSGGASAYEIRTAKHAIVTEEEWNAATKLAFMANNATAGSALSHEVFDLQPETTGYIAIRAFDNVANPSGISRSIMFRTETPEVVYEHTADSLDGLTISGPFGIEEIAEKGSVFSDSPKTSYGSKSDTSLTFPPLAVSTNDLLVSLWTRHDIEQSYDFGTIEASVDGGATWKVVQSFSGISLPKNTLFSLVRQLPPGITSLQLRLRFRSDGSVEKDGWYVDDLKVLAPTP